MKLIVEYNSCSCGEKDVFLRIIARSVVEGFREILFIECNNCGMMLGGKELS